MEKKLGKIVLVGNYELDGQYSMQLFSMLLEKELLNIGLDVDLIRPEPYFGKLIAGNSGLGKILGYLDKFLVFPRVLKRKLTALRKDENHNDFPLLIHICDHSNAIYVKYLSNYPHLVTCHDLMAVRSARGDFPQNPTRFSGRILQRIIFKGLRASEFIVCDSDNSRQDLIALDSKCESRSTTIHAGFNYVYTRMDQHVARHRLNKMGLPENIKFVLHVGNDSWYKNRLGVLRIFQKVLRDSPDFELNCVFAGKPFSTDQRSYIQKHGLESHVINIQNLTHEELQALYSTAELLLYPSHYEGFGWPPLEAQACGCPVVASQRGSLKEVLELSALIAEPDDETAFITHIKNILSSDKLADDLTDKGYENIKRFSTDKMITSYIDVYQELVNKQCN